MKHTPYIAPRRWYLTKAEKSNGLILIKTARYLSSANAAPVSNPAAILKGFRETQFPIGIVFEETPVDSALPARFAKHFPWERYDLRWSPCGLFFRPVKLRWHDDASYAAYQGDADEPDYNAEDYASCTDEA